MSIRYRTFAEFYPFYLSQHRHAVCRRLHLFGLLLGCTSFAAGLVVGRAPLLLGGLLLGYGFGWFGHFVFERNRPATLQYPLFSFLGDWVMAKDILTGKLPF